MGTLREILEAGLSAGAPENEHPLFPGAVALLMRDGFVIEQEAVGDAVLYTADDDGPHGILPALRRAVILGP
jgi:hypothetical protein